MQIFSAPSIRPIFDRHASLIEEEAARRREERRRHAFDAMEREDVRREKERKDKKEDAELLDALRTALASDEEIAAFTVKLDHYDALTVEALQENERKAAAARERIRETLANAAQLPDGRHVFKTDDGTAVFDEHGAAVSPNEIRPEEIEDSRPTQESYQADRTLEDALAKERQDLLAFQERLDRVRERIGKDGVTKDALDALEEDIDAAMPSQLRQAQENEAERAGPGVKAETGLNTRRLYPGTNANAGPAAKPGVPTPGIDWKWN